MVKMVQAVSHVLFDFSQISLGQPKESWSPGEESTKA